MFRADYGAILFNFLFHYFILVIFTHLTVTASLSVTDSETTFLKSDCKKDDWAAVVFLGEWQQRETFGEL